MRYARLGNSDIEVAAVVELSLAARDDAVLREVVSTEERKISRALQETATVIFGDDFLTTPQLAQRWVTALSAIRGLAMLKLLGHPSATIDRQWASTRRQLVEWLV